MNENNNSRYDQNSKNRKTSLITIVVFLICLAVFMVSAFKIISYFNERHNANEAYSDLKSEVLASENGINENSDDSDKNADRINFDVLTGINSDIIGWIRCEESVIDYPVLHTDNNDYYLNHLYNGEKNSSGSIFMDAFNSDIYTDKNVVIYGHSMKNGTMFNSLKKYKDQSYYKENPNMMLYTPEGDYKIELVSGTIEDGYVDFLEYDFEDGQRFIEYVQDFVDRSSFTSDVTVSEDDRIVTLCTCSYEQENARYVVIGKLVPVEE